MRPRLLDLFCGAGGASKGYALAGFDVVGVDIKPQPRYPFEFHQGDAIDVLESIRDGGAWFWQLGQIDAVHASPPCQRWTRSVNADAWPDLVTPVRELLFTALHPAPYVIENVPQAPLEDPTVVCGSSFGLRVRRHRAFETSFPVMALPCAHQGQTFITVAGGGPNPASFSRRDKGVATGGPDRKPRNLADALDAMNIDWPMTRAEVNEAIPPAYTEHIGAYLLAELEARAAA